MGRGGSCWAGGSCGADGSCDLGTGILPVLLGWLLLLVIVSEIDDFALKVVAELLQGA